jgi:hypothetical protein
MILPILERPDAERAPSAGTIALTDWADGSDPYAAAAPLLDLAGTYAISDSAWALQLLGLQQALPRHALRVDVDRIADAARGKGRGRARASGRGGGSS